MKTLIKTLSVLAIGGAFAGAAFAGPGDAHPPFAYQPVKKAKAVQIALYRAGEVTATKQNANVKTVRLPNANPKIHTPLTVKVATNPR
ncbi:MAG: hypothetical protein SFU53_10880 [Terrimicrobiaceae bacterium]|nr:hypothetical protein [Terrimicrobiaceae bacterium]